MSTQTLVRSAAAATSSRVLAVAVLGLSVLAGCGDDARDQDEGVSLLFVQNAESAQLSADGDEYTLALEGVDDQTVWFTDRPARNAGSEPTNQMLDQVLADTGDGPPNAALVWTSEGSETTLVVELLEADYQESDGRIVYRTRLLDDGEGRIAEFGSSSDVPTEAVPNPAFFIDAVSGEVCELDIYDEVQGADGHEFPVSMSYDTVNNVVSSPDDDILTAGETMSWRWDAVGIDDCDAGVIVEDGSGQDVAGISLHNPWIGDNSNRLACSPDYECVVTVLHNSVTYHLAMVICEGGVTKSDCEARAGF